MNIGKRLLRQVSGIFSTIMQGAGVSAEDSSQMTSEDLKELVIDYRRHLVTAVCRNEDCQTLIKQLVELDCPLDEKYAALHVSSLLELNNKSVEDLKHITCGLSTIVRCAQHLIKPPEQRRNHWRVILFNNVHIKKKVIPLIGFESVLQQLGYTEINEVNMSFPEGGEPDKSIVVNLIVDMMVFRKEMKEFIVGSHLHPEHIQRFIPQETLDELMAYQMSDMPPCDDDDKSDISPVSLMDPAPSSSCHQASASRNGGGGEYNNNNPVSSSLPSSSSSNAVTSSTTTSMQQSQSSGLPSDQEVRGDAFLETVEEVNNQNVAIQEMSDAVPLESGGGLHTSSSSMKLSCNICGDEAVVFCKDCMNKPLCDGCDQNWHKHPNRRQHHTDSISALANLSLESPEPVHIDGAYGIMAQTNAINARVGKKQQTQVVTTKKAGSDYSLPQQKELTLRVDSPKIQQEAYISPELGRYPMYEQLKRDHEILDYQRQHNMMPSMSPHHPTQMSMTHGHVQYPAQPYGQMELNSSVFQGFPPSQVHTSRSFNAGMQNMVPSVAQRQQPVDSIAMMNNYYQPSSRQYQGPYPQPNPSMPQYMQQQLDDHQRKAVMGQPPHIGWRFPGTLPFSDVPGRPPHSTYPSSQGIPHHQAQTMEELSPNTSFMRDSTSSMYRLPFMPSSMYNPQPVYIQNVGPNLRQGAPSAMISPHLPGQPGMHPQGNHDAQMNVSNFYGAQRGPMPSLMNSSVSQIGVSGIYDGNQNYPYPRDSWPAQAMGNPAFLQSNCQENNIDVRRLSYASSSSSSSNNLRNLKLEELLKIADPVERLRKCEAEIHDLNARIRTLEDGINVKIVDDEEFCDTEEFKQLSRHKASMMKEKKVIEDFKQKLAEETAALKMKSDDDDINARRQVEQDQNGNSPEIYYPPDIDISTQSVRKINAPAASTEKVPPALDCKDNSLQGAKVKAGRNHDIESSNFNNSAVITSTASTLSKAACSTSDTLHHEAAEDRVSSKAPNKSQATAAGSSVDPPAKKTHQYSVKLISKSQYQPDTKARVPVETSDEKAIPPHLPPRSSRQDDILSVRIPAPKQAPASSAKKWRCRHCTYINLASSHACEICHKTSDNPELVDDADGSIEDESAEDSGKEEEEEASFGNDRFIDLLEQIREEEQSKDTAGTLTVTNDDTSSDEDEEDPEQTHVVAPRILGSQEQVMFEKKQAQMAYQQQQLLQQRQQQQQQVQQQQQQQVLQQQPYTEPAQGNSKLSAAHFPLTPPKSVSPSPSLSPSRPSQAHGAGGQQITSSSDYGTPPSRTSPSPPSPAKSPNGRQQKSHISTVNEEGGRESTGSGSTPASMDETITRLNEISFIDSLERQGLQLAKLLKQADLEGYSTEAVLIAQSFCENQRMSPLEWLHANWRRNIARVITKAKEMGNREQQNSVGELSEKEAEEAYISCHGNLKEASQMCVDKRVALYEHLSSLGEFPREEILEAMFLSFGEMEASEALLMANKLQPFIENIWSNKKSSDRSQLPIISGTEMCTSVSTSVVTHGDFQRMIKDKNVNKERRTRMIFVEGKLRSWGRAELVIKILDSDLPDEDISLEDVVEAVRNCQDRQSALAYLQQECQLCFANFPMSKIRNLSCCQCKMCEGCLIRNFEVAIRERHVRHWTCPLCEQPDLNASEVASEYLHFLSMQLQFFIDTELKDLFETKIRDWHLQKQDCFRWCAHCAEGFLAENQGGNLRMTCPHCGRKTCFVCKKPWEDQHEGVTCEQFAQWKIDNDPTNQSVGLAKHLDENGIDCPSCKMRFALAKGGCMHFKCPQCGFEFCSGCNEPYHQKDVCHKYKRCKTLGLHCHCPRDCFSYLRDNDIKELQHLLQQNFVPFDVETPPDQEDAMHCPVMEQKEFGMDKKDEKCGKVTAQGQAGLCLIHYKEYLVYLINQHGLDPVVLMDKDAMVTILNRCDLAVPQPKAKQSDEEYKAELTRLIKDKLPLRRR